MVRWLLILFLCSQGQASFGADKQPAAAKPATFFIDEVWGKVGELSCLKCHNSSGEAKDSGFILQETILLEGVELQNTHAANFKAFTKMAGKRKPGQQSRLLMKPIGELDHEGEQVLKPNSTGLRILERFVAMANGKADPDSTPSKYKPRHFLKE